MAAEFEIREELIARQSPEAPAIFRLLLAEIAKLTARVAELEAPARSGIAALAVCPH